MANIDIKLLREKLYPVAKALFCMGEVCVDVSKCHISEEDAIKKIRGYLQDANLHSRFKVDQLIEDCMIEEFTYDDLTEKAQEYLKELNLPQEHYNLDMPSVCEGCSNNPKNGGSGICNCTIPYFADPVKYTNGAFEPCMANNINGYVHFATNIDYLKNFKTDANKIAEAVERTSEYEKRI